MTNMGWKADSLNIKQSCKEYAMSLGIDNSPVVRQATAEEMREFDNIKPYKGWTEADSYKAKAFADRQQGYYARQFTQKNVVNPISTLAKLKKERKVCCESRA